MRATKRGLLNTSKSPPRLKAGARARARRGRALRLRAVGAGRRALPGAAGGAIRVIKEEHEEEREERRPGRIERDVLHTEPGANRPGHGLAREGPDVDQHVEQAVGAGAGLLVRGLGHSAGDDRLDEGGSHGDQGEPEEHREPAGPETEPGVAHGEQGERHRERAAKACPVGERAGDEGQEPHQRREAGGDVARGHVAITAHVGEKDDERDEGPVVGGAFEELDDVGDPEDGRKTPVRTRRAHAGLPVRGAVPGAIRFSGWMGWDS